LDDILTSVEWRWSLLPATDVFTVVSSFLDSTHLTVLSRVSRLWHAAIQERYRSVHRLTFKEISCAKWLPPAAQLRCLRKLDLRRYIASSVPSQSLASSDEDIVVGGRESVNSAASIAGDGILTYGEGDAFTGVTQSETAKASSHHWLALFLEAEESCKRLRTLQLGPLVPKTLAAKFLGRCTNLRAVSLSGMMTDEVRALAGTLNVLRAAAGTLQCCVRKNLSLSFIVPCSLFL
jgi:hypothetical protein